MQKFREKTLDESLICCTADAIYASVGNSDATDFNSALF